MVLDTKPAKLRRIILRGNAELNVFVTESLPPPVTPPLSFITTVMRFVPTALVATSERQRAVGADARRESQSRSSCRR
jgi:hypothetical protein